VEQLLIDFTKGHMPAADLTARDNHHIFIFEGDDFQGDNQRFFE